MSDEGVIRSRSVWTTEDEARLQELTERKERILSQSRDRLVQTLQRTALPDCDSFNWSGRVVDSFIACAEDLRAALEPFCKKEK